MDIIKLQNERLIVNPEDPDLSREIEQFLEDSNIENESIPVIIMVDPPLRTVIENSGELSEILVELSAAYRTEGNYFLELYNSSAGILVAFKIEHTAASITHKIGHC